MKKRSRCLRQRKNNGGLSLSGANFPLSRQACLALAALTPMSAVAAEITGTLGEVIVTAQRREQSIQEVPVSVTAFSGMQLEERSMTSLSEIAFASPNFSFATADQQGNLLRIRGVGQTEGSLFFDAGVAVFLDGIYLPRMRGEDLDTAGIERIEVLRGPQGTLFGKNTIGGAINIVTARPGDEFSGTAEVTVGRFNRVDGKMSLDGPLVEGRLSARVVGVVRNRDGYGKRLDFATGDKTEEMGDQDSASGRLAVNWTPSEDLEILLSVDATSVNERAGVHNLVAAFTATCGQPGPLALLNCLTDPDYGPWYMTDDPYTSYATGPNYFRLDGWGVAFNAYWNRGTWGIRSISGFRHQRNTYGVDFDGSPINVFEADTLEESDQFSQEFQLNGLAFADRLNWIIGVYYASEDARMQADTLILQALYDAVGADSSTSLRIWQDSKSFAGYGQITYKLNEKLSLTAGARYSYDEKEASRERARVNTGVVYIPKVTIDDDWSAFTGRIGFEYHMTPDIMSYVSAARGYKSGGINGAGVSVLEFAPFDPEFLWTYEVGLRSEWFERRVRFNVSAFHSDYSSMQFRSLRIDPDTNAPINLIANVGSAKITGLEAELTVLLPQGWELGASLGYQDARYKDIAPGTPGVTEDMKLPNTPEWSAALFAQYTHALGNGGEIVARVDYSYTDDQQLAVSNTPYLMQPDYSMVNARLTYRSGSNWELSLFGTNLSNEKVMITGADVRALGWIDAEFGAPRQWGVSSKIRF